MFGVPRPKKTKRKYTHESFPEKLHRLIREAEQDGQENIVRFCDDGSKFQILSTSGFEGQILSKYFRHNKITSFKRLLHMYGFRRIQGTYVFVLFPGACVLFVFARRRKSSFLQHRFCFSSWNAGTFEHEKFHRDYPDLCKTMNRVERGFGSYY